MVSHMIKLKVSFITLLRIDSKFQLNWGLMVNLMIELIVSYINLLITNNKFQLDWTVGKSVNRTDNKFCCDKHVC